jgi:hypothetical protein
MSLVPCMVLLRLHQHRRRDRTTWSSWPPKLWLPDLDNGQVRFADPTKMSAVRNTLGDKES